MKKFLTNIVNYGLLLICLLTGVDIHAEMLPKEGIEPSGTLPVMYINTVDNTPIDQKEVYIDGTAWLDNRNTGRCESVGSESAPLVLGIRGRGNASWLAEGPKPYKIKFDKKQSFFGLAKNKHWVLLPVSSYGEYYNNKVGLELGRQLGMKYLPQRFPIEVVLNGTFLGVYMLSEHIRIDEGRVEIFEQPDLNEDDATVPYGWLVEIDNYSDPAQIRVPVPSDSTKTIRITHHTPEVLSSKQRDWLFDQFNGLAVAVHNENRLDRKWEDYVDMDDLVKHFLAQEILNNFDAYVGSCYLHKDIDDPKWHFGPLWDLGWSLDRSKTSLMCEMEDGRYQNYLCEIIKFPRFRKSVNNKFQEYVESHPVGWVDNFTDSLQNDIKTALYNSSLVWPELKSVYGGGGIAAKYFKENVSYIQSRLASDLTVYSVNLTTRKEDATSTPDDDGIVLVDGLRISNPDVNKGQSITITFESRYERPLKEVTVNGTDMTGAVVNNQLVLEDVNEDKEISVVFGAPAFLPATSVTLSTDSAVLYVDETLKVDAVVEHQNNLEPEITWTSSDENVATVDKDGVITAVSAGEAVISASCWDVMASCSVTVKEEAKNIGGAEGDTEVENHERLYIDREGTLSLDQWIFDEVVDKWTSSNNKVALVTNGVVRASTFGEAIIRAKDANDCTVALFEIFVCPKVTIEHGDGVIYSHHVLYNSRPDFYLGHSSGYKIAGVTHDGVVVTDDRIVNGIYTSPYPITDNTVINISLERNDGTGVTSPEIHVFVSGNTVNIVGFNSGRQVSITNMVGQVVYSGYDTRITIPVAGIYIIRLDGYENTYKFIIRN